MSQGMKGFRLETEELREWLASWTNRIAEYFNFNPEMPVMDRDREVWSPLFVIAEFADEEWEERTDKALIYLVKSIQEDSVPRETTTLRYAGNYS